jgi:hypothetical protein
MASALYAFMAFFAIASATLPRMSLLAVFAVATVGCLIAQGATLQMVRRLSKMEDAADREAAASSLRRG